MKLHVLSDVTAFWVHGTAAHPLAWCRTPELIWETCPAPAAPLLLPGPTHQAQLVRTSVSRAESEEDTSRALKLGIVVLAVEELERWCNCSQSYRHHRRLDNLA